MFPYTNESSLLDSRSETSSGGNSRRRYPMPLGAWLRGIPAAGWDIFVCSSPVVTKHVELYGAETIRKQLQTWKMAYICFAESHVYKYILCTYSVHRRPRVGAAHVGSLVLDVFLYRGRDTQLELSLQAQHGSNTSKSWPACTVH